MNIDTKKHVLQAVISHYVAKRDSAVAQINFLLENERSDIVNISVVLIKHFNQLAHAEKCIETVQKTFAIEHNKKILENIKKTKNKKD